MKVLVVTYGTEGDTRPLAALCRALIDAGHEARLLADRSTLGSALSLGVPAQALSGDIRAALMPGAVLSSAVRRKAGFNSTNKALAWIANSHTHAWMRETMEASEGCGLLILSGLAAFVGLSVAEYRGIAAIGAGFIPINPTAAFASPFLPPDKVPRWLNRASHRFVNNTLWRAFRKATNAARADVCGLPPRRTVWTDHPMLYGVSPSLVPQPEDWPANALVCGQWKTANPEWTPPPALEAFVAQGEPPVYIGFGSMAGFDPRGMASQLAAGAAGRRVVFYPGWSGIDASMLPDNFFFLGDTPHHWLFPRMSLVVHHGGAGTTHSAAGAGVPSVVVPFAADQFFWADRLRRLGVAAPAVMGARMRGADLARAIAFAERDEVRQRAGALGRRMAEEDGLRNALAAIERLSAGRRAGACGRSPRPAN
ncbi:glycosyltransferase [Bordetella genomosp. 9]|uniref:UDP-glucose--sterol glucosyltransferase n=1 Tax=Bordetella genomosp. 9 TaxID=1416803 RepID=A0A1W6YZK8_9BORD|nr:glycosyltransferase [Bordetella genomosp. 9]ARP86384.1 UDP-glucose--sterol glucosyltransferase [Bordetella genomosp. 9]